MYNLRPEALCTKSSFLALIIVTSAFVVKLVDQRQAQNQRIHSSLLPPSYKSTCDLTLQRLSTHLPTTTTPDTTAIILNWSRLSNVVRIVNLLCSKSLEKTIATVFIWNNSPQQLTEKDFEKSQCHGGKLRIYNSPSNLHFHARFLACAQATTQYCFIQDDDYLVWPEIITALGISIRRQMSTFKITGIHILPPHEKLSSDLRTIRVGSKVHTSFAWLGHGAMIPRSRAVEFLDLLQVLNATQEELKMADNYFTILSNAFPEIWFDQGVELGGGQPFTVGLEGDNRNNRHIIRAFHRLEAITECSDTSCIGSSFDPLPYVNVEEQLDPLSMARAPCASSVCLLETSINLLSDAVRTMARADHILAHAAANAESMGEARRDRYLNYPPSHAVDGRPDTAFCSFHAGKEGDTISLDLFHVLTSEWNRIEFVFLIDIATEEILRASTFEAAAEGRWFASDHSLLCTNSDIRVSDSDAYTLLLRECHIQMWPLESLEESAHLVRVRLNKNMDQPWRVFEVWLRGSRQRLWDRTRTRIGTLWNSLHFRV